jgi:hypothetical protein
MAAATTIALSDAGRHRPKYGLLIVQRAMSALSASAGSWQRSASEARYRPRRRGSAQVCGAGCQASERSPQPYFDLHRLRSPTNCGRRPLEPERHCGDVTFSTAKARSSAMSSSLHVVPNQVISVGSPNPLGIIDRPGTYLPSTCCWRRWRVPLPGRRSSGTCDRHAPRLPDCPPNRRGRVVPSVKGFAPSDTGHRSRPYRLPCRLT